MSESKTLKELEEHEASIRALNDLLPFLEGEEKENMLQKRDELDAKAEESADKILKQGTPELDDAIKALNELTQLAIQEKKRIQGILDGVNKVGDVISKAADAVEKLTKLIALGSVL